MTSFRLCTSPRCVPTSSIPTGGQRLGLRPGQHPPTCQEITLSPRQGFTRCLMLSSCQRSQRPPPILQTLHGNQESLDERPGSFCRCGGLGASRSSVPPGACLTQPLHPLQVALPGCGPPAGARREGGLTFLIER